MKAFTDVFIPLAYMVAAAFFIIGLQWLSSPKRARQGNVLSAVGMLIAVIATVLLEEIVDYTMIGVGLAIGALAGIVVARKVKMTAMPQMVGILNGFGGAASALVAIAEYFRYSSAAMPSIDTSITIMLTTIIGAVTFSGSVVAAGKLQEVISGRPILFPLQQLVNLLFFLASVGIGAYLVISFGDPWLFLIMTTVALVLGVLFAIPVGGADMPVVICLLNSLSGIAGALAGFVVSNNALIISGALVGASGLILTQIMCVAMNRSIANVLFSGFGAHVQSSGAAVAGKAVKPIQAEEAAISLAYARLVIIVPGYGMAVAQAQHAVRQLADELDKRGVDVRFAVHPVAGRMPGHMNVLLAEANVPYEKLYEMEQINDEFSRADVALIIGANDVVNPAARHDVGSPIYGMPILNADHAKQVIVNKRSMNPGFAGIENELFYNDNTSMLFGSAQDAIAKVTKAIKEL